MCQAFLYYYPKIESFPLCLSLPIYYNKHITDDRSIWTKELSLFIGIWKGSFPVVFWCVADRLVFTFVLRTTLHMGLGKNIQIKNIFFLANQLLFLVFIELLRIFYAICRLWWYKLAVLLWLQTLYITRRRPSHVSNDFPANSTTNII